MSEGNGKSAIVAEVHTLPPGVCAEVAAAAAQSQVVLARVKGVMEERGVDLGAGNWTIEVVEARLVKGA